MPDQPDTPAVAPARPKRFTRRVFLRGAAAGLVTASGTAFHAAYIAPNNLTLEHVSIAIPNLAPRWHRKRIVHLSDLHAGTRASPELVYRACKWAIELDPELVCVTGDWVDHELSHLPTLTSAFRPVVDRVPVIGSLGNHDYGPGFKNAAFAAEVTRVLRGAGITMLRSQLYQPSAGPGELCLVGLDDLWAGHFDTAPLAFAPRDAAVVVLSHNPDTHEDAAPFRWDLMLSGHTHGGQVCVPFVGPPMLPVKDRRLTSGLFHLDRAHPSRALYITRGVGHVLKARFLCPPEITCITLGTV